MLQSGSTQMLWKQVDAVQACNCWGNMLQQHTFQLWQHVLSKHVELLWNVLTKHVVAVEACIAGVEACIAVEQAFAGC